MSTGKITFHLPNFLDNWPWPRRINPHYDEVKLEGRTWLEDFGVFSPRAQRAFNACNFSLMAALLYPQVSKERLKSASDMMNAFFLYDEFTDVETKEGVQSIADISMDAVRHPTNPRPIGEPKIGEIIRQSWGKSTIAAPPVSRKRFVDGMDQHTASMTEQADDRSRGYLPMRSIASYLELRRHTMAAKPAFAFLAFDFDLPVHIFEDPLVESLETLGADLLILSNDLYSYPKEYASGDDGHNIVTIVMNELALDLDGAVKWTKEYHDQVVKKFLNTAENLPPFGDKHIDAQLTAYIEGIALFVRGHDSWCFESARYFGQNGLTIQKERVVTLRPLKRE